MRSNPRRIESGKYCDFHRDYGHDTNDCDQIRNAIEDAVRRGYLKYYVAENNKPRQERSTQRRRTQEPEEKDTPPKADPAKTKGQLSGAALYAPSSEDRRLGTGQPLSL